MQDDDSSSTLQKRSPIAKTSFWHFVAGGAAGTIAACAVCPLDVVKTRLQSSLYKEQVRMRSVFSSNSQWALIHGTRSRRGLSAVWGHVVDTGLILRDIHRNEGLVGLFRGLGPNLVGIIPARSIAFWTYGNGKAILTNMNQGREAVWVHLLAATNSGVITATVTNPIWVVKTRMQLQAGSKKSVTEGSKGVYQNSWQCAKEIAKREGVVGFYKGLSASYLGVTEGVIQWVIYEQMKRLTSSNNASISTKSKSGQVSWIGMLSSASTAKFIAALVAYPHETVRTRMRQLAKAGEDPGRYRTLLGSFKTIVREEGFASLYGGLTAHLLRVVPNAAILFSCYEGILYLAQRKERG